MESSLSFRKRAGAFGRDRKGHIIYAAGNGSTQRGHPEKNFLIAIPPRYLPSFFLSWSVEKLLPLLPPYPMEPPWAGRLDGWGSTFFYAGKRAAATTFIPFLSQNVRKRGKKQAEEDHTPEKGDGYEHAETGNRTGNAKPTEGQDTGCGLTRPRLQPDNTTVAARQYQSYHPAELQFQPDGTKVTILMKL